MTLVKKLDNYWKLLEKKYSAPRYVGKVNNLKFSSLKKAVDSKNEKYLKI